MGDYIQLIRLFMSSVFGDAIIWFGGLWVIVVFIRKVSKDADDELDPHKRKTLATALVHKTSQDPDSWIMNFNYVFDRFFGKNHVRWRCFYRSTLISLFSFVVIMILFTDYEKLDVSQSLPKLLLILLLLGLFTNAFVDYLSLLETRVLLNIRMQPILKILIDIVLTFILSMIWVSAIYWMFFGNSFFDYFIILESLCIKLTGFHGIVLSSSIKGFDTTYIKIAGSPVPIHAIIATSFTTSIWLWLHGFARLAIRVLSGTASIISLLDIKKKPIRAIGTTINAFILLLGVVMFPIYMIAK